MKNYETHVSGNILRSGNLCLSTYQLIGIIKYFCICSHAEQITFVYTVICTQIKQNYKTVCFIAYTIDNNDSEQKSMMLFYVSDIKANRNQIISEMKATTFLKITS